MNFERRLSTSLPTFSLTGLRPRHPRGATLAAARKIWLAALLLVVLAGPVAAQPQPETQPENQPAARDGVGKAEAQDDVTTVVVVLGAGGLPEYEQQFATWADRWRAAAREGGARYREVGRDTAGGDTTDRQRLERILAEEAADRGAPLWLVLIGHGTYYRDVARFNLRGPDFSARELEEMLQPVERPLVVINCASCSGPFLERLAAEGRTVVTATRSGAEQNFARFGDYLSSALTDPEADLDHDEQVSLLEAYLAASKRVKRFYDSESRLATEHALLDDNGDGLGTPAEFFRGARAVRSARDGAPLDGSRARRRHLIAASREALSAEQLARRDELEQQIEQLRVRKAELPEDAYYEQLEQLLIPLARLYE